MDFVQLFAAFAISVAATLLVIPPARRLAFAKNWVDKPDGDRKLHKKPVAAVGGIAIAVGSAVGVTYIVSVENVFSFDFDVPSTGFWAGAALMFSMGLLDDVRNLNFRQKFAIQLIAAAALVIAGFAIDVEVFSFLNLSQPTAAILSTTLSILWIVGIVNAVNLIDGLDGLAGGLCAIALASFALVFGVGGQIALVALLLPVIGALTGFLFHNFNPASIFMGNSGSYFLGFLLAACSLSQPVHADPVIGTLIVFVILGLPVLDTCFAMSRRVLRGKSPFSPDRDHVHHRLIRRFTHRQSVLIMYVFGAVLGLAGVSMGLVSAEAAVGLFVVVLFSGLTTLFMLRQLSAAEVEKRVAAAAAAATGNGLPTRDVSVKEPAAPQKRRRFVRRMTTTMEPSHS